MSRRIAWSQLTAWLILIAGLAISGFFYLHFFHRVADDAALLFEEESRDAQRAMETRLAGYAGLLLGLRGLHGASGRIDDRGFTAYVDELQLPQRYPAVRSLDHEGPASPGPGRGALYYPGPHGMKPPRDANSAALAKDLLAEIRDGGDFVLAGFSRIAGDDAALRLRLAVYDRRLAYAGSVGADVSLAQIIRDAVSAQTLDRIRISVHALGRRLQSGTLAPASRHNLLLDTWAMADTPRSFPSSAAALDAPLSRTSQIVLGGAVFELVFTAATGAFVSPLSLVLPVFALLAGTTISLLLFSLVNSLAQSRRGLALAVSERTRDLDAINQALQEEIAGRGRLEREIFRLNVDERRRFGQDLHDSIGQRLTAMGLMLESVAGELQQRPETLAPLARISGHISSALAHTRMLARGLNPVAVEAGGFASALARLAAATRDNFRVDCKLEHDGQAATDDAVLQHNLYRIAQQAITNAITHGRASRILIRLSNADHRLSLAIVDNGIGLAASQALRSSGLGLKIMRYRCSVLGLDLRMESPSGGGTSIVVEQRPAKE